ncbi:MAG: thioredoxin family protein [Phycisphaeraceae bacterium]|nr:thioredoxin family protein [Phycisphaeraceae bacterium]
MRHVRLALIVLLACGLLVSYARSSTNAGAMSESAATQPSEEAPKAPDFAVVDSHGKTHHLSDYAGKFVVLEWINHECPFVRKHYDSGNMQKLQAAYTDKGVAWLTICSSAPGKQGNMSAEAWNEVTAAKNARPTAVLLDEDGTAGRAYGAKTTPHMFVINPSGGLIYQGAIDDTPSADPADAATAHNYVTAALEEAMAGQTVTTAFTKSYGCSVKY